ncbi:hypothetical protein HanPSC8_Chr05g0227101 [Helianthus annuus]|nr:hypothetical protein HanPSC8_Chr05g0227101 [Helianthus annuus]
MDHVPAAGRSGGVVSMWDPGILKRDWKQEEEMECSIGVGLGILSLKRSVRNGRNVARRLIW